MDVRIVGGGQNQSPITAVTPETLGNRGAMPVFLVNASGDLYNSGGGASGGDGAINDGANSSLKASVLSGPTTRPAATSNPLLIQFADDPTRQLGQTSPPVTGTQILGGSVGARVQPSGDFPVQVGVITAPVGITGDVSTTPKAGQTWPVSIAGTVNVAEQAKTGTHVASGQVGVTGDVIVTATNLDIRDLAQATDQVGTHQKGAWNVGVSGDVTTIPKAGETWPVSFSQTVNVQHVGPIGVQVVGGGVGGSVGISGDVQSKQAGAWAVAVTGDVLLRANQGINIGNVGLASTIGVQVIGGGVGGTVSLSGDAMVSQRGGWATSVTGDVLLRPGSLSDPRGPIGVQIVGTSVGQQGISGDVLLRANPNTIIGQIGNTLGVNVIGGSVGGRVSISGDTLLVNQQGAWAVSVTGDVSTRPLSGQTWPVTQQGAVGVNILGSSGSGTVGISGDAPVSQKGGWAVAVTGDVLLRGNPNVIIGQFGNTVGANVIGGSVGGRVSISGDVLNTREQNVIGVQLVGGSGGGTVGVTGDVNVRPRGAYASAISGDGGVMATVRDYTNGNPLAVVLTNSTGDTYNAAIKMSVLTTVSGRFANQGSNSVVSAVAGRKIKVARYNLQGDGDNARGYFASGASGSQLTTEWELASREGVVEYVSQAAGGYLFATAAGSALSLESSSSKGIKYSVSYHTEDAL